VRDELKRREKLDELDKRKKKKAKEAQKKKVTEKGKKKKTKKDVIKMFQNIILAMIITGLMAYGTYERWKPKPKPFPSAATFEHNNISEAEVGKSVIINASGSLSEFSKYEWTIPTSGFSKITTEPILNFTFQYPNTHRVILSVDGKVMAHTDIVVYRKITFKDAMESGDSNDEYNWAVSRNASRVVMKITYDKVNWGSRNNLDMYLYNGTYHMGNTSNVEINENSIQTKVMEITNVSFGSYRAEIEYKSGEGYVRYLLDIREY